MLLVGLPDGIADGLGLGSSVVGTLVDGAGDRDAVVVLVGTAVVGAELEPDAVGTALLGTELVGSPEADAVCPEKAGVLPVELGVAVSDGAALTTGQVIAGEVCCDAGWSVGVLVAPGRCADVDADTAAERGTGGTVASLV